MNRQVYYQILKRLGVEVPADVPEVESEHLVPAGSAPPIPVHSLRVAIRRWFALTVAEMDGHLPGSMEVEALRQAIFKLEDEVGPADAEALIGAEARRFRWETGRCGRCGNVDHSGGCER